MEDSVDSGSRYGISDEYIDPWCDPCENDGKYVRVVSYCPICVEFFCKQCHQSHTNFQITKHHKVKREHDMPTCQADKPPKYEDCSIHARGLKEYFCADHSTMICRECQKDHNRCCVRHADEMSKSLDDTDINAFKNKIIDAQNDAVTTKTALDCNIKLLEEKRKFMLKDANKEYEKMKSTIACKFKSVSKQINNRCDEEVSSLVDNMAKLSVGITEYQSAIDNIQKASKSNLNTRLFMKMQTLVESTRQNMISLHETTKTLKSVDLGFDVDKNWMSFLSSDPEIGNVQKILSPCSTIVPLREIGLLPIGGQRYRQMMTENGLKSENMEVDEETLLQDEDYKSLVDYGINETVAAELKTIYDTGKLKHTELDERALDALKEFEASDAIQVLKHVVGSNLSHVTNKSAYLRGRMQIYRQKMNAGRGYAVPKGPYESISKFGAPSSSAIGNTPRPPAVPPKGPHRYPYRPEMLASGFYHNLSLPPGPPGQIRGPVPGQGQPGMQGQGHYPQQVQGQPRGQFSPMPMFPFMQFGQVGPRGPMPFPTLPVPPKPGEEDKPQGQGESQYQSGKDFPDMPMPQYFDPQMYQMFARANFAKHHDEGQPHSGPPTPYVGSVPERTDHTHNIDDTSQKIREEKIHLLELKEHVPSPRNKEGHGGVPKAVGDQEEYMQRLNKKIEKEYP